MSHVIEDTEYRKQLGARFWNVDGPQIAIVASITKGVNWAAYIGATGKEVKTEEETTQAALVHGCKLLEDDARHFFPGIELPYRH